MDTKSRRQRQWYPSPQCCYSVNRNAFRQSQGGMCTGKIIAGEPMEDPLYRPGSVAVPTYPSALFACGNRHEGRRCKQSVGSLASRGQDSNWCQSLCVQGVRRRYRSPCNTELELAFEILVIPWCRESPNRIGSPFAWSG